VGVDAWSWLFVALLTTPVVLVLGGALRSRFAGWHWWGALAFLLGWSLGVTAALSALDEIADDGSLSAHIAQHIVLGDIVAPLLLIGLAPQLGDPLRRAYARVASSRTRGSRMLVLALSPAGAVVLWSLITYFWLVPPVHRLTILDGPGQLLDRLSFLVLGLIVWLAAFDFRGGVRVVDWETLKLSAVTCDLPWWARHVYAMVTRLAMLPAVAVIWLMGSSAYFLPGQTPPGGQTRREDQVQAASMMLGFEILLSGLAVVLAFIFVSVSEDRARRQGRAP
jgi:hypothetical protein